MTPALGAYRRPIRSVRSNNRKRAFQINAGGKSFVFPYSRTDPRPTADDPVSRVFVDSELDREGLMAQAEALYAAWPLAA